MDIRNKAEHRHMTILAVLADKVAELENDLKIARDQCAELRLQLAHAPSKTDYEFVHEQRLKLSQEVGLWKKSGDSHRARFLALKSRISEIERKKGNVTKAELSAALKAVEDF